MSSISGRSGPLSTFRNLALKGSVKASPINCMMLPSQDVGLFVSPANSLITALQTEVQAKLYKFEDYHYHTDFGSLEI